MQAEAKAQMESQGNALRKAMIEKCSVLQKYWSQQSHVSGIGHCGYGFSHWDKNVNGIADILRASGIHAPG